MTLATHIVIATAITQPIAPGNPYIGFLLGLISHYLSDAIPHWDYKLLSLDAKEEMAENRKWRFNKVFLRDLLNMGIDFFLGFGVAYLFIRPESLEDFMYLFALAVGSTLPDFLQGVYYTRKAEFLKPVQTFHDIMHTKIKLGPYPLVGIPFQLAILFLCIYIIL